MLEQFFSPLPNFLMLDAWIIFGRGFYLIICCTICVEAQINLGRHWKFIADLFNLTKNQSNFLLNRKLIEDAKEKKFIPRGHRNQWPSEKGWGQHFEICVQWLSFDSMDDQLWSCKRFYQSISEFMIAYQSISDYSIRYKSIFSIWVYNSVSEHIFYLIIP